MHTPALDILRDANRNLRLALLHLQPDSNTAGSIDPTDLSGLLAELLRVAECLRNISLHNPPTEELSRELGVYRANLQELAQVLPSVHGRLLTDKARLEMARSHVHAATGWTQLSQTIL